MDRIITKITMEDIKEEDLPDQDPEKEMIEIITIIMIEEEEEEDQEIEINQKEDIPEMSVMEIGTVLDVITGISKIGRNVINVVPPN